MTGKWRAAVLFCAGTVCAASALPSDGGIQRSNQLRKMAWELEQTLGQGKVELELQDRCEAESRLAANIPPKLLLVQPRRAAAAIGSLLQATNGARKEQGLAPLSLSDRLSTAANDRLHDMRARRYFDHIAPDGSDPFLSVCRRGYLFETAGENLATGYSSADAVVRDWLESPRHRANVLGDYDEVGIAVMEGCPTDARRGYTYVALYGRELR